MSLPAATADGVLPPGLHSATIAEIEARFGTATAKRMRLMAKLHEYLAELRRLAWDVRMLVDGSFVMDAVKDPSDIDIVLVMPEDWDFGGDLNPFAYNALSRKRTKKAYRIEVFPIRRGEFPGHIMLDFFQQIKPERRDELGLLEGIRKGIVEVSNGGR